MCGHKQSIIWENANYVKRKTADFNIFIASAVQYRFHNLMVKIHITQKHGVNESYQLSTVYKHECHCY